MYTKQLTVEEEKLLQAYCAKMPVIMQQTQELHYLTGAELIEMGYVEREGEKIDPGKTYRYHYPVLLAANHYRRLKRAWLKNGYDGIVAYLQEVKKAVDLHRQQKNEHV